MLQSNASVWCGYSARLFGQTTPEQTHVVSAGSFSAGCLFRTPSHHRSERGPYLVTTVKIQAAISVLLDMGAMAPPASSSPSSSSRGARAWREPLSDENEWLSVFLSSAVTGWWVPYRTHCRLCPCERGRAWQPYSSHHFRPPPPLPHQRTGDVPGKRMQHYGFASPLDAPP
jgi:hypothetical protein